MQLLLHQQKKANISNSCSVLKAHKKKDMEPKINNVKELTMYWYYLIAKDACDNLFEKAQSQLIQIQNLTHNIFMVKVI